MSTRCLAGGRKSKYDDCDADEAVHGWCSNRKKIPHFWWVSREGKGGGEWGKAEDGLLRENFINRKWTLSRDGFSRSAFGHRFDECWWKETKLKAMLIVCGTPVARSGPPHYNHITIQINQTMWKMKIQQNEKQSTHRHQPNVMVGQPRRCLCCSPTKGFFCRLWMLIFFGRLPGLTSGRWHFVICLILRSLWGVN